MRNLYNAIFLVICIYAAASAQPIDERIMFIFPEEKPMINLVCWKMSLGDSSQWSIADYNDSGWIVESGSGLWVDGGRPGKGVRWYRKSIFLPEPIDSLSLLALYQIAIVSAYEVYWDGKLIARNGVVGSSEESEKTGCSGFIFPIPPDLTNVGKHVIALRMSNFSTFSGVIEEPFRIGYFSRIYVSLIRSGAFSFFLAGIFIITALFHFAILLGHGNKWTYSLFSAFCLSCAVYIVIRSMLKFFQIDVGFYYTLAALNDIPWFFMIVLLPIFFLFEFSSPFRIRFSAIIVSAALVIVVLPRLVTFSVIPEKWLGIFVTANQIHTYATFFLSIIVAVWGLRRRIAGSLTAAIGLVIFLVGVSASYLTRIETGWAIGFAVLILFMTVSLSRQMAHRNKIHQEAQLRSARLELELLKKHIQPHFLLNSLNSIIAWLEEDPATASRLVNALAEELRMLLNFSGKTFISLSEEVRLCEIHCRVMSLRQEKEYVLETEGILGNEMLPPLIIHTLLENGMTHGYKGRNKGRFLLVCEHKQTKMCISLFNDSSLSAVSPQSAEGTGMRYIRSRLQEAFPSKWSLIYGPVDGGWKVSMELERLEK